jgi:protein-disulfide isomerase
VVDAHWRGAPHVDFYRGSKPVLYEEEAFLKDVAVKYRLDDWAARINLSVVVIGLLVIGVLSACQPAGAESTALPLAAPAPTPIDPAPMEAAPSIGLATAPVTIIEYADFGCPSCWAWYKQGVLDKLRAKYGDQIRFVWRDFPVITLLSPKAAEAGQCAHEQGKFWEFHDAVYSHDGAIEATDLKAYATAVGLNMAQYDDCVITRRYRDRVNAEQQESFDRGLRGTPEFFVNGLPIVGPQRLSVFEDIIDPILAAKK